MTPVRSQSSARRPSAFQRFTGGKYTSLDGSVSTVDCTGVSRFLISARQPTPFVADAGLQFPPQAHLLRRSIGPPTSFFLDCLAQSGVGSRELLLGLVTQVCAPRLVAPSGCFAGGNPAPRTSRRLQPSPSARRLVADRAPLTPANFRSSLAGLPPPLRLNTPLMAKKAKTLSVSPSDRV